MTKLDLTLDEAFVQEEREEGTSEYVKQKVEEIQEKLNVGKDEAWDWFRAVYRHGRYRDMDTIQQAVERVDLERLCEILAPEALDGDMYPVEVLQEVVDVLAEAFGVGHKINLEVTSSNNIFEGNDYGRYLDYQCTQHKDYYEINYFKIIQSERELEGLIENCALRKERSIVNINRLISNLVANLAHEVWHAFQIVQSYETVNSLEDGEETLPSDCPQGMLYQVNFITYIQEGDCELYYESQLVEREANSIKSLVFERMQNYLGLVSGDVA